jgi:DNA-directed RNA polymerase subunit alpha
MVISFGLHLEKAKQNFVHIALQRALLGEIEGTCITCDKFGNVPHKPIDNLF